MSSSLRHVGLCLALAATLLRALVPNGWMPNATGAPIASITLCTVNGPVKLGGPQDPAGKRAPSDAAHMDVCPFAAAPHAAVFGSEIASVLPPQSIIAGFPVREAFEVESARPYALQSPRAPPLFV